MIKSISISKIASYDETPEELNGLSQFNFLFGSNGTGKTTVSRVMKTNFQLARLLGREGLNYSHWFTTMTLWRRISTNHAS